MSQKAEFAERLKQAMQAAGYEPRPGVLEKEFNTRYWGRAVSFQAASRWLKGLSIPEQDKLVVLADWLRVEPQVLRFGAEAVQRVSESNQRFEAAVSYTDRDTFEAFLNLPAAQRQIVRDMIRALAEANDVKPRS